MKMMINIKQAVYFSVYIKIAISRWQRDIRPLPNPSRVFLPNKFAKRGPKAAVTKFVNVRINEPTNGEIGNDPSVST